MLRDQLVEFGADGAGKDVMESVVDWAAASAGGEGSGELLVGVRVLEQGQAEAENAFPAASRRWLGEQLVEVLEAGVEQVSFVGEVAVEGGPAHIGAVDDVLDGDRVVALLDHQGQQRIVQRPAGAAYTPIGVNHRRLSPVLLNSSALNVQFCTSGVN